MNNRTHAASRFPWLGIVIVAAASLSSCHCHSQSRPEPINKVVLITIDTLRADRLGAYGYTARPNSPALDAWSKQALLFEHTYSQAPWTVPSMASLLTGYYPREAGAYTNKNDIRKDVQTLPELFKARGYRTASFNTNPLLMRLGFRRGFDEAFPDSTGKKIPFSEVEPHLMRWLDQHAQEKFFIWVHDMDPHAPPTEGNRYLHESGWKPYDAEVRWVDEAMGRVLAKLDALGIRKQTLVVFTADHGEAFGEHKLSGHQNCIYDEVLHVPLIIDYAGLARRGRVSAPVELLDVYPTIVALAGLVPAPGTHGESLVPIAQHQTDKRNSEFAFSSRFYFTGDQTDKATGEMLFRANEHHLVARSQQWKLIAKVAGAGADQSKLPEWDLAAPQSRFELYNTSDDPEEKKEVAAAHADVTQRLKKALAIFHDMTSADGKGGKAPAQPDAATLETLRQLGYD